MIRYVARRLSQGIFVLFGVTAIVFILIHLSGDPAELLLPDVATAAQVAAMRERLGLDRPLAIQYGTFLLHALQGDFGESIRFNSPSLPLVLNRLRATGILTVAALIIALMIAMPAGVLAALKRGTLVDRVVMSLTLVGYAVPTFYLAIMLILIISVRFRMLPPSGFSTPQQLILPSLTLGLYEAALLARLLRRGLVDVYANNYIRTARAKGLKERSVLSRHALKNALIPVVTVFGLQIGSLLGGAVITETVFSYPGVGFLLVQAIYQRDFAIVEAFVIVSATAIVVVNLLVDIVYSYLDPRIKSA
jgi:ABC-type dipeptide/oligopeptide/nickel transport system permease component